MREDAKIKAVVFDLGETLLHFGRISTTRVFREGARNSHSYLRELGQPVGSFEVYCWKNLLRLRLRTMVSALRTKDFDAFELLRLVGIRKGMKLTDEQWREYAWRWYEPLSRRATVEPGTVESLEALRDSGLKLAILSNTWVNRESLERHMEATGLLRFFKVRIYSYEQPKRKPDPGIFRMAADRVGEALENIMYVGDRIDKDIRPSIKLGMHAVLKEAYTNEGQKTPDGASKISRISELPKLIETINTDASEN